MICIFFTHCFSSACINLFTFGEKTIDMPHKKHLFILVFACFLFGMPVLSQEFLQNKNIHTITEWKFYKGEQINAQKAYFDDSNWEIVNVPHTWNATDILTKGPGHYKGTGWYRTSYTIDKLEKGRRYFIRFNGASITASVYVNGMRIGDHKGGFSAFCYEMTQYLEEGDNSIAVKVNNEHSNNITPSGEYLYSLYGGIYRPVNIITTGQLAISPLDHASSGIYVFQDSVSHQKADLRIITLINNGGLKIGVGLLKYKITDKNDEVVIQHQEEIEVYGKKEQQVEQHFEISNPHLWDAMNGPYLYTLDVTLIHNGKTADRVTQSIGLRYYHVDADSGFYLNGKRYNLHGVCRHQEWEGLGNALEEKHHIKDMEYIREMGANAIRFAHYQQADKMYSLCDKHGLVAWAEIPVTPIYQVNNPLYHKNCKQQLTELIKQNFNHPAIVCWGMYNEVPIPADDLEALHNLAKELDPTRLTTQADHKEVEKRHAVTGLVCWNRYDGWYYNEMGGTAKWAKEMHKEHPAFKLGVSEYGAGGCISQQKQNPGKPNPDGNFFPEQYQCIYHEVTWDSIKDISFIWGTYIWNMFDFAWPNVDRGDRKYVNHKGMITYDRKTKKDVFFFYKANWSDEPVLHITSKRHKTRHDSITEIKIYANCDQVELLLNEDSKGIKKGNEVNVFEWHAQILQQGNNEIKVVGKKEGISYTDKCIWVLK